MDLAAILSLETELLDRLYLKPVAATAARRRPASSGQLDGWLARLMPKNAQEAAVMLTAIAALLGAAHELVDAGQTPPEKPPAVTVTVECPPALAPPSGPPAAR